MPLPQNLKNHCLTLTMFSLQSYIKNGRISLALIIVEVKAHATKNIF